LKKRSSDPSFRPWGRIGSPPKKHKRLLAASWALVPGSHLLKQVAVASANKAIGVDPSGKTVVWDGEKWTALPTKLAHAWIADDGTMFGADDRGAVYSNLAGDEGDAATVDLPKRISDLAIGLARRAWGSLPDSVTKSPYANRMRFLADVSQAARELGPTVLVPMGVKTAADFEASRKNVESIVALRVDGVLSGTLARLTMLREVAKRAEATREHFWGSVPGDAKFDRAGFDREFVAHLKATLAELEASHRDGAKTPAEQKAVVQLALTKMQMFTGQYAERKLNERARQREDEERRRKEAECFRSNRVCVPVPTMNSCGPWNCCRYPGIRHECRDVSWHDPACMARQLVSRAWEGIKQNISQAWEQAKNTAEKVWKSVETGAKWVNDKFEEKRKFLAEKWEQAKGLIASEWERAKELLRDPVGYVWKHMKERLLQLWDELVIKPVNKAKEALEAAVNGVRASAEGLLRDHVITPAMKWAIDKVFGDKTYEKVVDIANKILGSVEKAQARDGAAQEALEALAERDLAKFDAAFGRYEAQIADLKGMRAGGLLSGVVDYAQDRLTDFIRGKAVDLFNNVFDKFEIPLDAIKTAAVTSLGSIPFAGGILAGLADFIITEGIRWLREKAVEFVAQKVVELVTPLLNNLSAALKKVVGRAEGFLQPIIDALRPVLADVNQRVATMVASYERVAAKLKEARARIAAESASAAAEGAEGGGR
jgi:hypothetical protein